MQIKWSHWDKRGSLYVFFFLVCRRAIVSVKGFISHAGSGYFLFPQTVCVPVAIKEDFRLADISLVKCGPEVRGPPLGPAASVHCLSLPQHTLQDANPDTNVPVIRDVLSTAAQSVRFKYETGCVLSIF